MKYLFTILAGAMFAVGITIGGMTVPSKVLNFLDVTGNWDPSLMLVMVGAIGVYAVMFYLIMPKMEKPLFDEKFKLPTKSNIDLPLILGAATFGAGWGVGGFCPGAALTSSLLLDTSVLVFILFMIVGMYGAMFLQPLLAKK
ncbi:MAG: transporter [Kangiella sp.]|nr:MAG: transporter [Kangiella sp.]